MMYKCNICKEYVSTAVPHHCPPKFLIYHEDYLGDEPETIYAYYAKDAAKKYAERYDESDYTLLNGNSIEVKVVDEQGNIQWFELYGESCPQYYARELAKPKD